MAMVEHTSKLSVSIRFIVALQGSINSTPAINWKIVVVWVINTIIGVQQETFRRYLLGRRIDIMS